MVKGLSVNLVTKVFGHIKGQTSVKIPLLLLAI